MAPEVIEGDYGKQADMWSLGVLLYTLVSGYMPFYDKTTAKVFVKIKECDWEFVYPGFNKVSNECRDLINKLLVKDPSKRLTGKQALNHNWFKAVLNTNEEEAEVD